MRIKFLSVIVSFLLMSIAISSCLDSDENYEYSSDATIRAFGIDTITYGKYYKFTIDQLKREIYNVDSLPVGADTIIDRILIDTLTITGWVTSGLNDTLFNMSDSVDLREPIELTVHAADGVTSLKYLIKVNVHKQDPDSLVWKEMSNFSNAPVTDKQKSVILKNSSDENKEDLYLYTSSTTAYHSLIDPNGLQWNLIRVQLPPDAILTSIVNFKDQLYVATNSKKLFSSANGTDWEEVNIQGTEIETLVASLPEDYLTAFPETLSGILIEEGTKYFCSSTDGATWVKGEAVPADFPTGDIYSTIFTNATGIKQTAIVGNTQENEPKAVTPWFSMNGLTWADMSTTSDAYCPGMTNPSIMYYGGMFHVIGGEFETIYSSYVGIAWYKTEKKFLYPTKEIVTAGDEESNIEYESLFKGKGNYSLTIDKNNYIWIVWNDGSVWRARQNKLGFIKQ